MKIATQVFTSFCLLIWPVVAFISPMIFDAPGSTSRQSSLAILVMFLFYPVVFGALFLVLNWKFWGMAPKYLFVLTLIVPMAAVYLFGYGQLFSNMAKGIDSSAKTFVKNDRVYRRGSVVAGADAATFKELGKDLSSQYSKDAQHVYFETKAIEGADAQSFENVASKELETSFWKDKNFVYYDGKPILGADPKTFSVFHESNYARDKNHVFYTANVLSDIDPESFSVVLNHKSYGKDKAHVYFLGHLVFRDIDPKHLQILDSEKFAEDNMRVFSAPIGLQMTGEPIAGAEPSTFQSLDNGYAKDKKRVYFRNEETGQVQILVEANPEKFKVTQYDDLTKSDATDMKSYYLNGEIVRGK